MESLEQSKHIATIAYMSIFAILGTLARIIIAQIFGEECRNPGTVGWLAASSPLCVTSSGSAESEGGIIFADLPANILGSFIMGMLQSTSSLGMPFNFPIAWVSPDSWFQELEVIHLAMRTGFCGSLTTFSSWNSAMVILTLGTGSSRTTEIVSALLGYFIGMETALGAFVFGKKVAEWIFRARNPEHWQEVLAIRVAAQKGTHVSMDLPDFERRFLADLNLDNLGNDMNQDHLAYLERWRISTHEARKIGHSDLECLNKIERQFLIERDLTTEKEYQDYCMTKGWDLRSLMVWSDQRQSILPQLGVNNFLLLSSFGAVFVIILYAFLVTNLIVNNGTTAYSVTSKTIVFALLWSPPGALLRWKLGSSWNGSLKADWSWFPIGTWAANIIGSMVSITAIAVEYISPGGGFWIVGTLRSVKVGFAGSLTTVSTFVAEIQGMTSKAETQDKGYIYIILTLLPSYIIGIIIFSIIRQRIEI
jgi:fluoride exporter